jgi:hypothetical protein
VKIAIQNFQSKNKLFINPKNKKEILSTTKKKEKEN